MASYEFVTSRDTHPRAVGYEELAREILELLGSRPFEVVINALALAIVTVLGTYLRSPSRTAACREAAKVFVKFANFYRRADAH